MKKAENNNTTPPKKPCTDNEYEQLIKLRKGFVFLIDPPKGVRDSDYSYKKREVLDKIKPLWPLIERLCEKFNISLKISVLKAGPSTAEINYSRVWSGRDDFVKSELPQEKIINLEIIITIIGDCEKPISLINKYKNTDRILKSRLRQNFLPRYIAGKEIIQGILDNIIIKLGGYFETDKKPAGIGKEYDLDEID
ncbi:MAG TPA: hypothetical protein ENH82_17425 [bacterium]|nr:hypothetical protein [bacterium]